MEKIEPSLWLEKDEDGWHVLRQGDEPSAPIQFVSIKPFVGWMEMMAMNQDILLQLVNPGGGMLELEPEVVEEILREFFQIVRDEIHHQEKEE